MTISAAGAAGPAVGRLMSAAGELVTGIRGDMGGVGRGLRGGAVRLSQADERIATRLSSPTLRPASHSDDSEFLGRNDSGEIVSFRVGDVRSVALRDSDGTRITAWARSFRYSDSQIEPGRPAPGQGHLPEGEREWDFDEPVAAPWSGRPVYWVGHGNQYGGYEIQLNRGTRDDPQWESIGVDASTIGRVSVADHNYRAAAAEFRGGGELGSSGEPPEVALIACRVGGADGWDAEVTAWELQDAGLAGKVHAPKGLAEVGLYEPGGGASYLAVEVTRDATGRENSLFTTIDPAT